MLKTFFASRKWVIGTGYVFGVIACDLAKRPLDPNTVMWTAMVVLILVGGQHVQEAIAARIAGTTKVP